MSSQRPARRTRWPVVALVGLIAVFVFSPVVYAEAASAGYRYDSVAAVPARDVALVLGAGVYRNGAPTPYLKARLDLGYELYEAGKVKAILVSGDNGNPAYNEPVAMQTYLLNRGVPADKIVLDYAGFDTYASCVRAIKIFGATSVVVVTQSYHLPRAVTTCRAQGIDAVGVGDSSVLRTSSPGTWVVGVIREVLADSKMVLDLVSDRQPVLGPRETSLDRALGK